jgi:phage N-6-adenine-methyltransferase
MNTEVMFSSKTDEWETPQDLFDELNREFIFSLDVCANENNHKCADWFNKQDNGLEKKWSENSISCWMNPPYGREILHWVKKAYETSLLGSTVVCLLPARTDTKWFHEYILDKAEIRFIKGRLKFGGSKKSAPFPSMIVIFRGVSK